MNFLQNIFAYYVVNFDPVAIHFPSGWPLDGIRWYGFSYLAGFLIGMGLMSLYVKTKRSPLTYDQNSTLVTYLLFGVIIGARLGFMLLYEWDAFSQNPLVFFQIWKGGMASHGGFIGVTLAIFLFCRIHRVRFMQISDIVVTVATPGIFLGRLANFVNGELWGTFSSAPWAMVFPASAPAGTPIADIMPRHPSQLYEALAEGLLIFLFLQYRFWKSRPPAGQISGEFLIIYAIMRMICEHFREYDSTPIFGLSRGVFYSIFCIAAGIAFIVCARRKNAPALKN